MDDGSNEDFLAGEVMRLPPGRDAWCVSKTACVFVELSQGNNYYSQLAKEWHEKNDGARRSGCARRPVPLRCPR